MGKIRFSGKFPSTFHSTISQYRRHECNVDIIGISYIQRNKVKQMPRDDFLSQLVILILFLHSAWKKRYEFYLLLEVLDWIFFLTGVILEKVEINSFFYQGNIIDENGISLISWLQIFRSPHWLLTYFCTKNKLSQAKEFCSLSP